MAKYHLTNKAVNDLAEIWNYTFENWSENQADKYYHLLVDSFNDIANKPKIGRVYNGIIPNLKGFQVGKHIVFYREIDKKEIEIIRILHERMDLRNRLSEK